MPLRDHFQSPINDRHSWNELHSMWPMTIVKSLFDLLPPPYHSGPFIHRGTLFEADFEAYIENQLIPQDELTDISLAATYVPPLPTITLAGVVPGQDNYEVRIYNSKRQRRLVAAVEIVSPSNKDRPEHR